MPRRVLLPLGLVVLTLLVHHGVLRLEFVNYDDPLYVTENPQVLGGLTSETISWSLTAFVHGNWHPVTILSHMLDVELFGLDPAGPHAVNLLLHVFNVLLLFGLLAWTTSRPWPSALAAALFSVHPLNVESVAWVSERKNLLCTLFWLLALLAHVRRREKPGLGRAALVFVLAALALASKPMAVTLPFTLALFDFWPLRTLPRGWAAAFRRYGRELAPLFALSAACGLLTLAAQRAVHAIQTVESYPLGVRLGNAAVAYVWYLKKAVWPEGLAVFYPHPLGTLDWPQVLLSVLLLLAISFVVLRKARDLPFLAMGWGWYVVTLLPVVGLVQVGSQAYADRYAYVPLLGPFVAAAWGLARVTEEWKPALRQAVGLAACVWVGALGVATREQISYWTDSVALFHRAATVVPGNAVAHNNLGMALAARNRMGDALEEFRRAVAFAPADTDARSNLGNALRALGRPAEAAAEYKKALETRPDDASIHYNLATALGDLGRVEEAQVHVEAALARDPQHAKARMLRELLLRRRFSTNRNP